MNNNMQVTPFDAPEGSREIVADRTAEPIVFGDLMKKMGLKGEETTAEQMVNATFDILRAKPFESSFEAQDHAWYVLVRPVDSDKLFNFVVGGSACVEVLDTLAQMDSEAPIRVTLRYKQGGKFNGYYFFE